ncbi:hypothetical protein ACFP1H_11625 [Secundilactobacillus hailunensis]|uniref:Transmembrane protein n=1 Tax=Secundilactobacillus hailunensis TaxID=2559923 RepID=A0ABW1TCD1_9LACO|nr:hypothetical protein [Secundilactobacillus hailunensis]
MDDDEPEGCFGVIDSCLGCIGYGFLSIVMLFIVGLIFYIGWGMLTNIGNS